MDVITATVERLLAAIKKPVGAVQANKILGDLHYPQLSSMLPYRFYDADSGLYVNKSTVGFMLEATPLIGANEHIVQVLDDLVKSKLPRKVPISVHLVSTKVIGDQIDHGIAQFSWQGKHAERFNRITRAFYHSAAHGRFGSPTNLPLTLRDYRVYISYCAKAKKLDKTAITELSREFR